MMMSANTKTAALTPSAYERVETALRHLLECLQCSPDPEIRHSAKLWMAELITKKNQDYTHTTLPSVGE
jgi:hypothetical protein